MGNIIIGIKRTLQNKNTVTILALLASVAIIYFAYNFRIKKSTEPVNVPYAVREIGPRTLITNEMVSVRKVPGGVVTKNVVTSIDNIVGKYVVNTAVIPEGSMFYTSTIATWDELPQSVFSNIEDKKTIYALSVDLESTYGNSIFPGNYIDIYYRMGITENNQNKIWIGKFIESIRVLDVVDGSGKSVFETNGTPGSPAQLLFDLDEEEFLLFKKIDGIGQSIELFPVQRNAAYSKNPEKMRIVGNEFKTYVEKFAVDDSIISPNKGGK